MCGRIVQTTPTTQIGRLVGVDAKGTTLPSYNVAPGRAIWNFSARLGSLGFESYTWGLVPHWAKDLSRKNVNATAERIAESPAFRDAFRLRRSIIFVDGFYEWNATKQPYYIHRKDSEPMALAAIFDTPRQAGELATTCAIITTIPNEVVARVHNRMPVILPQENWNAWVDRENGNVELLKPSRADDLEAYPVSKAVNNPKNDSPELLRPLSGVA